MSKIQSTVPSTDQTGTCIGSEAIDLSTTNATPSVRSRGVYVSVTGTIVGRLVGDSVDSTWTNVPVGDFIRSFSQINKTGTTATVLYFLF